MSLVNYFNLYIKIIFMKNTKSLLGFTLIELLVVITIIGILATWAVSVFTSQIQKARDSTRITSLTAIKSWVEQSYQDESEYPEPSAFSWVTVYTPNLPIDPKTSQSSSITSFEFAYAVWPDENWITGQDYEVSVWFENQWNVDKKAWDDGGSNENRLEIWIDLSGNNTRINWDQSGTSWVAWWIPSNNCIGASWTDESITTAWDATAACSDSTTSAQSSILVIR